MRSDESTLVVLFVAALCVGAICSGWCDAISVSKVPGKDLSFGSTRPDILTDITITISPEGLRSAVGPLLPGVNDTYEAAEFAITGDASTAFSISLPGSTTLASGASSLAVTEFVCDPSSLAQLDSSGTATLKVGASLTVPARCPPGAYSGSFSVTVNYQ